MMQCYEVNPLSDSRWDLLVRRHPFGTVFHSPSWLRALNRTYGYYPVALTTSPPDSELSNGLVYCHVSSWVTGRRLVSLPFSDHCDSLISATSDADSLLAGFLTALSRNRARY